MKQTDFNVLFYDVGEEKTYSRIRDTGSKKACVGLADPSLIYFTINMLKRVISACISNKFQNVKFL